MLAFLLFGAAALALPNQQPLATAIGGALDSTHAHSAPAATPAPSGPPRIQADDGLLTITVANSETYDLVINYRSNSGASTAIAAPTGVIAAGTTVEYVADQGWAGVIILGHNDNDIGSKIESSFFGQSNIDVSYVDGYTLPITCSCDGRGVVTGCGKDLFALSACDGQLDGPVCPNPARSMNDGPAAPFFAPCTGSAYTFPNDSKADTGCQTPNISCCAGVGCGLSNPAEPA